MGGGGGGSAPETKPDDTRPAIRVFKEDIGVWPSNADVQWVGKGSNLDTGNPEYKSKLWRTSNMGNTPAPKGHYIVSPFNLNRSTVSGLRVPNKRDTGNPTTVAFYAGRVWYAGVESSISGGDSNSSRVFFSQVIESINQAGKCYQSADPTSEEISDLIASDGGSIRILGAGRIHGLIPVLDSMIVVADNGVWQIANEAGPFTATSYAVTKVTTDGCIGRRTIVNIGNALVYWAKTGIIFVTPNAEGILSAENISEKTVQRYYLSIPAVARADAIGSYDRGENVVSWLYCEDVKYANTSVKTHELNFRIAAGGFYKYKFAGADSHITGFDTTTGEGFDSKGEETGSGVLSVWAAYPVGYVSIPYISFSSSKQDLITTTDGEIIQDSFGEDVVMESLDKTKSTAVSKKYVINAHDPSLDWGCYFAEYSNRQYLDVNNNVATLDVNNNVATGEDPSKYAYPAFMEGGYATMDDPSRDKEITYLTSFIYKHRPLQIGTEEEPILLDGGGAIMSVNWDFSSTTTEFDTYQSSQFQTYRWDEPFFVEDSTFNDPFIELYPSREMVISKNRVNGNGKAASLRVDVPPMKGCHILGYSLELQGVGRV